VPTRGHCVAERLSLLSGVPTRGNLLINIINDNIINDNIINDNIINDNIIYI
jgi:hypothetical protein